MRWTGPLESAALLTVLRVPARAAASTRGVLPWAPLVGLVLGALAAGVGVAGARLVSPLTGAVLAVTVLAALTRGLHLDGLADTADGLGPLRGRERALEVMRQGDVGPFGVVPETRAGRLFRDTLGSVNQRLAGTADEVWFVVAGLPQRLR